MAAKTAVTRKQAEGVLAALHRAFPAYVQEFATGEDGTTDYDLIVPLPPDSPSLPRLFEDWDGYAFVIIWESGSPYDWPQLFPHGGIDEEFGGRIDAVELPKGVWTEAVNGCVLAIYPKD